MNKKAFWIACLSGAVLTTLVSNLPLIGFVNCFICAGFWGSAIFAVWLYQRLGVTPTVRQAVNIGLVTGVLAGVLGFLLSFAGLAGVQRVLTGARQILPTDASKGLPDIAALSSYLFNFIGVLFNIGFGALGGWFGGLILNRKPKAG
jgi:hypothetical protein